MHRSSRQTGTSLATLRFSHAAVPDDRAKKLEDAMLKAMHNSVYQAYLASSGLDNSSVLGADDWGKQMKKQLAS